MNQAQINPPKRVWQMCCGVLVIPALFYVVFTHWWFPQLGELQRLYLREYVKISLTPGDGGGLLHRVRSSWRTLYCVPYRDEKDLPAVSGMKDLAGLHRAYFLMTKLEYREWLQNFVYRKQPLMRFVRPPLMLTAAISFVLFLVAWKIDRYRHLKFRSTVRHLRGSRLVSRAEFRQHVKGEASGWLAQTLAPRKVRFEGIGWRTEDFQDEAR